MLAGLLLGIVNAIVRPIAIVLTLPITILTLGFFLLVVNTAMVALVAGFLPGFHVTGFLGSVRNGTDRRYHRLDRLAADRLARQDRRVRTQALAGFFPGGRRAEQQHREHSQHQHAQPLTELPRRGQRQTCQHGRRPRWAWRSVCPSAPRR